MSSFLPVLCDKLFCIAAILLSSCSLSKNENEPNFELSKERRFADSMRKDPVLGKRGRQDLELMKELYGIADHRDVESGINLVYAPIDMKYLPDRKRKKTDETSE
jgi:hypothetical protein